jgi:hypothetical protein
MKSNKETDRRWCLKKVFFAEGFCLWRDMPQAKTYKTRVRKRRQ